MAATRYRKQQLATLIVAAAMLAGIAAHAQAAGPAPATAPHSVRGIEASMLAGKLHVSLPPGFARTALPPDDKGGAGAVYVGAKQRQMVFITESAIVNGAQGGDDDPAVLDAALAAHLIELDKPTPNYRRLATTSWSIKGLGMRRTDGTTSFFDKRVHSTSLIAASKAALATVMIMTPIEDSAGHQALVASILDSIAANR